MSERVRGDICNILATSQSMAVVPGEAKVPLDQRSKPKDNRVLVFLLPGLPHFLLEVGTETYSGASSAIKFTSLGI